MKRKLAVSETEWEILKMLWKHGESIRQSELLSLFEKEGREWKRQTLNTFLNGLQKMKLIQAERGTSSPYNEYRALCTKEQHIHQWTKEMVEVCYDNSFSRLVSAFIGDGRLSKEDAEELSKLLK